jgi:hypothetical protein
MCFFKLEILIFFLNAANLANLSPSSEIAGQGFLGEGIQKNP